MPLVLFSETTQKIETIWKKVTRTDRAPLDTPQDIHDELDLWFQDEFGWRARSEGLFCWPLKFTSQWVQGKWLVFPAGKYKYIWSDKVDDLWATLGGYGSNLDNLMDAFHTHFSDSYTNKNIKKSMIWGGEIMIKCKYSYLARAELMEPLNEALGLNWQGAKYKGRIIP